MLFAAIDTGSNAVRLYFANTFEKNNKVIVEKASLIRIPLRLGEDVFGKGFISVEKRVALVQTMTAFKMLIDVYKPLSYLAVATSAMREAVNNEEVLKEIHEKAGVQLKIITGPEEARILCGLDCVPALTKNEHIIWADVGGGSTEISVGHDHKTILSESFRIGTVRMLMGKTEKSEWVKFRDFLKDLKSTFSQLKVIGSGGNINKLAKLYGHYESHTLSTKQLIRGYEEIKKTPMAQRIEQMGMRPDRADVIEPASEIFITLLKTLDVNQIHVPKIGLTDGLIQMLHTQWQNQSQTPNP